MREQPWGPFAAVFCLLSGLLLTGCRTSLPLSVETAAAPLAEAPVVAPAEIPDRIPLTETVFHRCSNPSFCGAEVSEPHWVRTGAKSGKKITDMTKEEAMKPGPWEFAVYGTGYVIPEAGFSDRPGHVSTGIAWLRFKAAKRVGMGGWFQFDAVYEYREYAFDKLWLAIPVAVPYPNDPVNGIGLRVRYLQAFSERWGAFAFGRMRMDAENGASLGRSITWIGTLGIGHIFPNKLILGVGAAVIGRPEEPAYILPAVQFSWPISDRWYAELDGTTLKVEYSTSPCWTWALAGYLDSPKIRLDDDFVGWDGLMTDTRLAAEFRATWTPRGGNVDLQLRLGADVYRELEFHTHNDWWSRTIDVDPAPYIGFRVKVSF